MIFFLAAFFNREYFWVGVKSEAFALFLWNLIFWVLRNASYDYDDLCEKFEWLKPDAWCHEDWASLGFVACEIF